MIAEGWQSGLARLLKVTSLVVVPAGTHAAAPQAMVSTQGFVSYLQSLWPLSPGIAGIVALFFLFTREITRFVHFVVMTSVIAVVFYTPGIVFCAGECCRVDLSAYTNI